MPFPPVAPLPIAASRINRPDEFGSESAVFLADLQRWSDASNSLASYINTAPLDVNNWGRIIDVNPEMASLPIVAMMPSDPGSAWAGAQDSLWASLESVSMAQDAVGGFVDEIGLLTGSAIDVDRPEAIFMQTAPTRGLQPTVFNSVSAAFYQSASLYTSRLNVVSAYFNEAIEPDDFGMVNVPSTITIDWGTL